LSDKSKAPPLMSVIAYVGYTFVVMYLGVLERTITGYSYYFYAMEWKYIRN